MKCPKCEFKTRHYSSLLGHVRHRHTNYESGFPATCSVRGTYGVWRYEKNKEAKEIIKEGRKK